MAVKKLVDDPSFAEALAKYGELQNQASEVRKVISELEARLPSAAHDEHDAEAMELITGRGNLENAVAVKGQLAEMRHKLEVLERAIVLQRKVLESERARASRVVCDARRGEYTTLIGNLAKTIRSLKAAIIAERNFREELIAGDVSFAAYLYPMGLPRNFDGSDGGSCDAWLAEAAQHYAV